MGFHEHSPRIRPASAIDRSVGVHNYSYARRPTDERLARGENSDLSRIAESATKRMLEAGKMNRLLTALGGDSRIISMDPDASLQEQIGVIKTVLRDTPFLSKFLPPDLDHDDSRAAYIAGIIKAQIELQRELN